MTPLFVVGMILVFVGIDYAHRWHLNKKQCVVPLKNIMRFNPSVGYTMADGGEPYNEVIKQFELIEQDLRDLRDNQTMIPCTEKFDICDDFDHILDQIQLLKQRFANSQN